MMVAYCPHADGASAISSVTETFVGAARAVVAAASKAIVYWE